MQRIYRNWIGIIRLKNKARPLEPDSEFELPNRMTMKIYEWSMNSVFTKDSKRSALRAAPLSSQRRLSL